jgi:tetratricopeptide (TPR) repeat protein
MGYFYFMNNKLDLAESSLRASLASRLTSYAWSELSRVLWAACRYDEALEAAEKAIAMSDNQASAWRIKGMVLAKRGNYTDAKNSLEKAVARDPKDYEAKDALAALPSGR